jgi:hypothetical protein
MESPALETILRYHDARLIYRVFTHFSSFYSSSSYYYSSSFYSSSSSSSSSSLYFSSSYSTSSPPSSHSSSSYSSSSSSSLSNSVTGHYIQLLPASLTMEAAPSSEALEPNRPHGAISQETVTFKRNSIFCQSAMSIWNDLPVF